MDSRDQQIANLIKTNEVQKMELRAVRAERDRARASEKLAWEKLGNQLKQAPQNLAEQLFKD